MSAFSQNLRQFFSLGKSEIAAQPGYDDNGPTPLIERVGSGLVAAFVVVAPLFRAKEGPSLAPYDRAI
jgi:hypothetical protein